MKEKTKMISQQLEQQKEYVAYKEAQLTKNDSGEIIVRCIIDTTVVICSVHLKAGHHNELKS